MNRAFQKSFSGVWSAAPTPLTESMELDTEAVARMVEHHLNLGVTGLFLAGSCGEGPLLPDRARSALVRAAANAARKRLPIAVQVTDNSSPRILDNIRRIRDEGADIAILTTPFAPIRDSPDHLYRCCFEAIERSPLPAGFYDLGNHRGYRLDNPLLVRLYSHPNLVFIKDSSGCPNRRAIALEAKRQRPGLALFNGDEFNCVEYIQAGYDGLMLGGAVLVGDLALQLSNAVKAGRLDQACSLQERMSRILLPVYGGPEIACWLSGLKYALVRMGIFNSWKNFPDYPLTENCRRAVHRVLEEEERMPDTALSSAQAGSPSGLGPVTGDVPKRNK